MMRWVGPGLNASGGWSGGRAKQTFGREEVDVHKLFKFKHMLMFYDLKMVRITLSGVRGALIVLLATICFMSFDLL